MTRGLAVALVLVARSANAEPLVQERAEVTWKSLEGHFMCQPGVPPSASQYPTASSFELVNLPIERQNARGVGMNDPKRRIGDHCAELRRELDALLPQKLVLTRVVKERFDVFQAVCTRSIVEEMTATFGPLTLTSSASFVIGDAPPAACGLKR